MNKLIDKVVNLLDVKTIITLLSVCSYLFMEVNHMEISAGLSQLVMMEVAFYFGTQQAKKVEKKVEEEYVKTPKTKN